jgi:hypothetical protein
MSDNRYFSYNCPALMQDGRFITNYTQRRTFDQYIRSMNKIDTAQDYKYFLQMNGDNLKPEEHPLHMLDNQADPENKPKIILQKAIRTYESDVADAIANKKTSSILRRFFII